MKINIANNSVKLYFILVTAISIASYKFFFNFGAFGVIFYEYIFVTWIVSVAIFLAYTFIPGDLKPFSRWGLLPLLIPSIWFLLGVWDIMYPEYLLNSIAYLFGTLSIFISLPYMAYLILAINQEEAIRMKPRRLLASIFVIFLIVSYVGYSVGKHNYLFMTCRDFTIAGYNEPTNCWKGVE